MGNREKAIAERLRDWEKEFRTGNVVRSLDAISLCLEFDQAVPQWASNHFIRGNWRYGQAEVKTLDEAFEVKRPKSWHQNSAKNAGRRDLVVPLKVFVRHKNGVAVTKAIDGVASELNMSYSAVRTLYYSWRKTLCGEAARGISKKKGKCLE